MRINDLRYEKVAEVTFDDFVCTPDGGLDYHPYLTTHLSGPDWERIYEGIAFANRLGAVLNVHVTIAWECAGIWGDDRVSGALVQWTEGLRKWCRARKHPCHYVYVHERARDQGLHTHLLTAVPHDDKDRFQGWAFRYLQRIAGHGHLPVNAICVRHRGDRDVQRQWLWFGYLMKGLSPSAAIHSGRDRAFRYWLSQMATFRLRPSGIVRCRFRAGVSRNIDREARQRYGNCGFASRFVRGATTPAELFTDAYLREFEEEEKHRLAAAEPGWGALMPPGFSLSSLSTARSRR
jgi:hypothetical protein